MPLEGTETIVEQPGGATTTTVVEKPNADNPDGNKPAVVAGAQPDKTRDYDREIAGFKADLKKERETRQRHETDLKAARAEVEAERKRIQALVGVTPKSDREAEEEQIKQQFAALYPDIAALTKEDIAALRELRATAGNLTETTNHYWVQHGRQMVANVQSEVAKEIGGKLTERQQQRILDAYTLRAQADPAFLERHENGDKTLATEFAKEWVEDWFEPARRRVTQQESQRFRAVPDSKGRGIVTHGEKKIDVNDPKAVEDLLVKGWRERNGEFTGRK